MAARSCRAVVPRAVSVSPPESVRFCSRSRPAHGRSPHFLRNRRHVPVVRAGARQSRIRPSLRAWPTTRYSLADSALFCRRPPGSPWASGISQGRRPRGGPQPYQKAPSRLFSPASCGTRRRRLCHRRPSSRCRCFRPRITGRFRTSPETQRRIAREPAALHNAVRVLISGARVGAGRIGTGLLPIRRGLMASTRPPHAPNRHS
jgi:hypothetical protein